MPSAERDKLEARVGDHRHARIGDQSDFRALLERDEQLRGARHLVVLVIADERLVDVVMLEEFAGVASVLAGDLIRLAQNAQCPERDVLEIADGRGDQVKAAAGRRVDVCAGSGFARHTPKTGVDESIMRQKEVRPRVILLYLLAARRIFRAAVRI